MTQEYKALLIHALRLDLDDETATPREAVEHLKERFNAEYGWRLQQTTRLVALSDWLQGLALNVPFYHGKVYQWAHDHGQEGASETLEAVNVDEMHWYGMKYWRLLAEAADSLLDWLAKWQAAEKAASDPDPDDYKSQYDEALDETQDPIHVGGITLDPSNVIKKCDPIAYRCGLLDYIGNLDIESDTQDFEDESDDLEALADDMGEYFAGGDDEE